MGLRYTSCDIRHTKQLVGFTLIELLVVVAVVGIVLGGGLVAYNQFDQKQRVIASGRGLMLTLREAQKKAKSGEKPVGCAAPFTGWSVSKLPAVGQYRVAAMCNGNPTASEVRSLAVGVEFETAAFDILFEPVTGQASGVLDITLTDSSGDNPYTVSTSAAGGVGQVGGLGVIPSPTSETTPVPSGPPAGFNEAQCPLYQSSCELYTEKCNQNGTGCDLATYWCNLWSYCP